MEIIAVAILVTILLCLWAILVNLLVLRKLETILEKPCEKLYTYYCLKQPPEAETLPGWGLEYASAYDERMYVFEVERYAYGYAMYSRMLEPAEISAYGLISAPLDD